MNGKIGLIHGLHCDIGRYISGYNIFPNKIEL